MAARRTGSRTARSRPARSGHEAPARGPRALLYLAGAAAVLLASGPGPLDLGQSGLVVAGTLALVGLAGGVADGPWGAVLVVAGASAGALVHPHLPDGIDVARDTVVGVGAAAGLVCVIPLELTGRRWGPPATALAVAFVVAVLLRHPDLPALRRPGTWGAVLLLLGAVNLLLWARDREAAAGGPRRP